MENVILTQKTAEELINQITTNVLTGLSELLKESRKVDLHAKELLSAKETEAILKISNVTRWNWTNSGILKSYKIGSALRYKKDEVLAVLISVESKKR